MAAVNVGKAVKVYLGIGSNIDRERSLQAGLDDLLQRFGELALSPVYDSPAVGFVGDPFFNLVAAISTELPLAELSRQLRALEVAHGRPASATRLSARQLDIDILCYGDWVGDFAGVLLPRPEILYNAFVLRPLADLAAAEQHPARQLSYSQLWEQFDKESQSLKRVDFYWRGEQISAAG